MRVRSGKKSEISCQKLTDEVLVLPARRERRIFGSVAWKESRASGDSMVVCTPHKFDGVANGSIDSKGHVAEDALSGGNNDGMGSARSCDADSVGRCWGREGGGRATIGSHTFCSSNE